MKDTGRQQNRLQGNTSLLLATALLAWGQPAGAFDAAFAAPDDIDEERREALVEARSTVEAGLGLISEDNTRWGEFRGRPGDGVFPLLDLDLHERPAHDADEMRWQRFRARDLGLDSRSFLLESGVQGEHRFYLGYDNIAWNQWPELHTPFQGAGSHALTLPEDGGKDTVGDFLLPLDIDRDRETLSVGAEQLFASRWQASLDFDHERTRGTRMRGFGQQWFEREAFLAPEPLDTTNNRLDMRLDYGGERLHASAGWHLSLYSQNSDSAMTTRDPHAADWSQAEEETWSLNPDNLFHQFSLAGGYTLQPGTRITGDVHLGRMLQDERFVEDADLVDRSSLNGRVDTTTANVRAAHRFHPRLRSRLSWRYRDRDNRTRAFEIDGRMTRPLSTRRETLSAELDYRLFRATNMQFGYEQRDITRDDDYSHRRKTDEDRFHLQVRSHWLPRVSGGARGETARKRGTVYDRLADDVSPEALRNFDLADRDSESLGLFATVTPLDTLSVSGRLDIRRDDYVNSALGRTDADRDIARLDGSWGATDWLDVHGFWSYEETEFSLAGDDWRGTQDDRVLTFGGGVEGDSWIEDLRLGAEALRVETSSRTRTSDEPNQPDVRTRLAQVSLFADYEVDRNLSFEARYMIERFRTRDWNLDRDPTEFDDVLVLGRENPDYTAHLIMASGIWRF